MKKNINKNLLPLLFLVSLFAGTETEAASYNFKILTNKSGLSNSAILSMHQDHNGYMWLGTCDGLNVYDGQSIEILKPSDKTNSLSGNLIEDVIETHDNIFWVHTNYGLNRFDRTTGEIRRYNGFKEKNYLLKTTDNDLYIFFKNKIYYYLPSQKNFKKEILKTNQGEDILDVTIDSKNHLWVFRTNGVDTYKITRPNKTTAEFQPTKIFSHEKNLLYSSSEKDVAYFVDKNYDFFEYSLLDKTTRFITNLENTISQKGSISSIIKHNKDYLIGFQTNGLLQLQPSRNRFGKYEQHELNITSGVFCLLKDKYQDIIWVGTDGQGVYICSSDPYTAQSITFASFYNQISKPIRSIFLDEYKNLWLGTKGDGILKIANFSENANFSNKQLQLFSVSNSHLKNNSVYAFEKSKKDLLWIGHDDGLNFYSYKEQKIKPVNTTADKSPMKYVHSIRETNDTTLWIASVGNGIYRATIKGSNDNPQITNIKQITIEEGEFSANYFFTLYQENDSVLWFGNRGNGAYHINTNTMEIKAMTFGDSDNNRPLNDVFSITSDKQDNYWFGTSFGLIKKYKGKTQTFNETTGFPNNTIHGLLKGSENNLWLSTNNGIIRFNRKLETYQIYNQNNGLEIIEFSDGAYFKDHKTGDMYFGGINGLVRISENANIRHEEYIPEIMFSDLNIFGKRVNINDFTNDQKRKLKLDYDQNFFSLKLTVIDFLNSNNYVYSYKLEGLNDKWIENEKSNIISFTNIPPGNYTLHTRFKNPVTNITSKPSTLQIKIVPPWYRSTQAIVLYFVFYALLVFAIFRLIKRWYSLKNLAVEAQINKNKQQELYESKLQFFTNITHELCTPLTLIQGPCEKIISHTAVEPDILKYASLIKNNSEKLNTLIQELIEFRRIDTDNKRITPVLLQVSELTDEIASSFTEMAESKNITYIKSIKNNITWISDKSSYTKILTNLLTNAFKYTNPGGTIEVVLDTENENLNITILNTGKGIPEDKIDQIFDRYRILDDFEGNAGEGFPARNGLGLAICHKMTQLLKGNITVTSIPEKQTQFKVTLPNLPEDEQISSSSATDGLTQLTHQFSENNLEKIPQLTPQKPGSTILIVDDDEEMLWFLSDLFENNYRVEKKSSAKDALQFLETKQVDLIISDIIMGEMDGIALTRNIKQNKFFTHIPIILLSAINSPEYKIKGIEAGADIYLSKPFNTNYLIEIVNRFLIREKNLKDYYNSIFSAIEIEEGTFIQREDKEFYIEVLSIIENNLSNSDLSADMVSNALGYSKRNLYRRLKQITEKSITELIKEYRFKKVQKYLISTKMSTDEIMYKTGFHNRGHFYKIFKDRYSCTPKEYRNRHKEAFAKDMSQ
ncbi:hybrid sensor histidine kinase/response regulator transcription factor [Marinilabilia salmonicolor]|uniref:hybrid sensor histidine kinase/response regulator transcription factor n=1 Tax=Marinilabilia salmonicolor TaxID=989 RepID=UPI0003013BB7|nr:hybrid sensor histidine kinase/response regulator transcription factor [Marinilabilia salmonicolor]